MAITQPTAYWTFDGSNANDSVGSNNGTSANITYSTGNGKISNGGGYNGTSSKITFASTFSGTGALTIGMWINTTASGVVISAKRTSAADPGICKLNLNSGKLNFWDYDGGFGFSPGTLSTNTFNDGAWHLIGVSINSGHTALTYYIDGQPNGTSTSAGITLGTEAYTIGWESTPEWFTGAIDEAFVVAGTAYTDANWVTVYNGGAGQQYPFSEASGPANLKSLNTNAKANVKSYNTNVLANIKSINTNA